MAPLSLDLEALSYVNTLLEAFRAFDVDNNGLITINELKGIMSSLGYKMTDHEAKEMMTRGDSDRDGMLSLGEFLEMNTKELEFGNLADVLQAAISALGPADGVVKGEELAEVVSQMAGAAVEDCMDIIACLDGDGDGVINLEDFKLVISLL
ncbi:probable calcium-binding protein CML29 [Typha latifolia]|uniref:probable calcium-binding protein CML29 n=1 Tax=Typha latifolia TaxID=4733 RepID=UPI003C30A880